MNIILSTLLVWYGVGLFFGYYALFFFSGNKPDNSDNKFLLFFVAWLGPFNILLAALWGLCYYFDNK